MRHSRFQRGTPGWGHPALQRWHRRHPCPQPVAPHACSYLRKGLIDALPSLRQFFCFHCWAAGWTDHLGPQYSPNPWEPGLLDIAALRAWTNVPTSVGFFMTPLDPLGHCLKHWIPCPPKAAQGITVLLAANTGLEAPGSIDHVTSLLILLRAQKPPSVNTQRNPSL